MSYLNEYFDAVYCINLDRRPDRWESVLLEFAKYGLEVERYSAVDGSTLAPMPGQQIAPNELACTISHRNLLEGMSAKGQERILIFEDDIYFTEDPNRVFKSVADCLPDNWDMVYLGGNFVRPPIKFGSIWKCVRTYTTSSYGINKQFADKMVPLLNHAAMQIDVVYAETQIRGQSFCIRPSCTRQLPGFSDIQNGYVNYDDNDVKW